MVFPVEKAKYHSPYHFRPTHHVVSKNKKREIAAAFKGEEYESIDMRAEQSNNRNF